MYILKIAPLGSHTSTKTSLALQGKLLGSFQLISFPLGQLQPAANSQQLTNDVHEVLFLFLSEQDIVARIHIRTAKLQWFYRNIRFRLKYFWRIKPVHTVCREIIQTDTEFYHKFHFVAHLTNHTCSSPRCIESALSLLITSVQGYIYYFVEKHVKFSIKVFY